MTSAIYTDLVYRLRLKQDEERRFLIRHREELDALRREISITKKLLADIRGGRLDECDARAQRKDVADRLTMAEASFGRLQALFLAETGKHRKPKGPVGPRKPLTAAQATKVADRDEKRRDRLRDLQASIATKSKQIADVKARLGH